MSWKSNKKNPMATKGSAKPSKLFSLVWESSKAFPFEGQRSNEVDQKRKEKKKKSNLMMYKMKKKEKLQTLTVSLSGLYMCIGVSIWVWVLSLVAHPMHSGSV